MPVVVLWHWERSSSYKNKFFFLSWWLMVFIVWKPSIDNSGRSSSRILDEKQRGPVESHVGPPPPRLVTIGSSVQTVDGTLYGTWILTLIKKERGEQNPQGPLTTAWAQGVHQLLLLWWGWLSKGVNEWTSTVKNSSGPTTKVQKLNPQPPTN